MEHKTKPYQNKLIFAAASLAMLLFGIVLISLGSVLPHLREQFQLTADGVPVLRR